MSTAELFLEPDEAADFIRDTLATDGLVVIGDEGSEIGLCPYITFYIYHTEDQYLPLADKMIGIYAEFSKLIDVPFERIWKEDTQDWLPAGDKRLPALHELPEVARRRHAEGKPFWLDATDQETEAASARWAFCARVRDGGMRYTTLKLTFRHKWYRQNKARWHAFVLHCLALLQPEHCYSGFEVGNGGFNVLGAYEADVMERICADHFYGMDIDHVSKMGFHSFCYHHDDPIFDPEVLEGMKNPSQKYTDPSDLGAGLRTPTWCFLLTPFWRDKLGKSAADVRAELCDPRIEIVDIPFEVGPHNPKGEPALWIRLGELDLHPVEQGVPEVLIKANRLIRPIRCDRLQLLTLDPWDDDPNPRFDFQSAMRWMGRFDEDSDWPCTDARTMQGPLVGPLRCEAGQPCPRDGEWETPAQANSRRRFKQGEVMPSVEGDYGQTIWQWVGD
ncbi:MAG: hypothetical protein I8H76_11625 [Burkholderiales bacterium]|nr:hypothetical protein [Burkholderiales bacterium]MBH2015988.1 hypothetical protein [Burkholderiales bacterium]